jgi:hypothetical protein
MSQTTTEFLRLDGPSFDALLEAATLPSPKASNATSRHPHSAFTVTQGYLATGHGFAPVIQKCHISPSQWNPNLLLGRQTGNECILRNTAYRLFNNFFNFYNM